MATVTIDARDAAGPRLRGWGRYAHELVASLQRQGDGLEIDALEAGVPGPELLFEQIALPRHLRRTGADLVHAPNCFLPLRRPCPGVVTIHDLAFEVHPEDFSRQTGWKYRTFTPRAARSAERVICVSEHTRDDVCERYGVDPERTRVVLSAPSLALGHTPPPPGPYLLAVGDLRRKKNLARLVSAFGQLREEGIPHRLILAGLQGAGGEHLRALARDAPIELPGYVADAELDALIRGAELLVYPSLYEGFGLAVVEAMARGTPVAASNTTALPEAGGDAAAYFEPTDVDDIAATIREVLTDPGRREQMAERGRRRAAELTWERTANETAAVYRELL
ncbi:MAG: glycosyltransferase family 4 protein [Thermoleophilaceae bacterium]|jgi:glycosyltransferase involved in cell wall biosynthesis|nr:glycosyltransferase family 4 protein [Thermoleophilaceae bacterium]